MIKPEIKEAVKILYVEKGYKPAEIADITGIHAATVYEWINNTSWKEERINNQFKLTIEELANIPAKLFISEIQEKKFKAKALIIEKNYNQKEAAKLINVSEKTMSQWCRKYKWKGKLNLH